MTYDDVSEDQQLGHLERLQMEMESRGFRCRVDRGKQGDLVLRVANPRLSQMSEEILVVTQAGQLWFWWEWGERLKPVAELEGAADVIARVLAADAGR